MADGYVAAIISACAVLAGVAMTAGLAYQREKRLLARQWQREDEARWLMDRRHAYADVIASIARAVETARLFSGREDFALRLAPPTAEELLEAVSAAGRAIDSAGLIAGPLVDDRLAEAHGFVNQEIAELAVGSAGAAEGSEALYRLLRARLRGSMREELGHAGAEESIYGGVDEGQREQLETLMARLADNGGLPRR